MSPRRKKPVRLDSLTSSQLIYKEKEPDPVKVKYLIDDEHGFTYVSQPHETVRYMKDFVGRVLKVQAEDLKLKHKYLVLKDNRPACKIKRDDEPEVVLNLIFEDNTQSKSKVEQSKSKEAEIYKLLICQVEDDDGNMRDVYVSINEQKQIQKPFVGGYIDRLKNLEYHHGYSQTGPPPSHVPIESKNSRDTQTVFLRNRLVELKHDCGTNTTRSDIFLSNHCNYIITAQKYETAEEREERLAVERKTRTIQRYYRAFCMIKALQRLSREYWKRIRTQEKREQQEYEAGERGRIEDAISKIYPLNVRDFHMLHSCVNKWKEQKYTQIGHMYCGAPKTVENLSVFQDSVAINRKVDDIKRDVMRQQKIIREREYFKRVCKPIRWLCSYKYIPIKMYTMGIEKGKEYAKIFEKVVDNSLDVKAKIEALLDFKLFIKADTCPESAELHELIDRACSLLSRGFSFSDISVLQQRIMSLIVHHFDSEECFEDLTQHIRFRDHIRLKNSLYCTRCCTLKPPNYFRFNGKLDAPYICRACKGNSEIESPFVDIAPMELMLKKIRRSERIGDSNSAISFILRPIDIYYIVNNIWHSRSALSGAREVHDLTLARWKKDEMWSPWNCVLLTKAEAKAHLDVENLDVVYEREFIDYVLSKLMLGANKFRPAKHSDKLFANTYVYPDEQKIEGFPDYRKLVKKHQPDTRLYI